MNPKERRAYRWNLLKEIYNAYFANAGSEYLITVKPEEDAERYLALQYLLSKKYITNTKPDYNNYSLVLTVEGIDFIENL